MTLRIRTSPKLKEEAAMFCQPHKLSLRESFFFFLFKAFVIGRQWCNVFHFKLIKAFLCADGKRSGNMDTSAIYTSQILMHIHTAQRQAKSRQTHWQISAWISLLLEEKQLQCAGASSTPHTVTAALLHPFSAPDSFPLLLVNRSSVCEEEVTIKVIDNKILLRTVICWSRLLGVL